MLKAKDVNRAYLNRHCVMPNKKEGKKGDLVEKDVIGEDAFEQLAHAGVLVDKKPEEPKKAAAKSAKK